MVRRRGGPTVSFNRPTAPGDGDVADRVEAVYAAVDALGQDRLDAAPVPRVDDPARAERLDRLERLAGESGRREVLDLARDRLQQSVLERWVGRLTLAYGMQSVSTGRVEDRAAIVTALRDLVAVAVMRDRLDPDDAEALALPGLHVVGASDLDELDAMTLVTSTTGPASRPETETTLPLADERPGAPTDAEWAEAELHTASGATSFRPDPIALLFGGLALVGLLAVLAMRVRRDEVVLGLVLVGALLAAVFLALRARGARP